MGYIYIYKCRATVCNNCYIYINIIVISIKLDVKMLTPFLCIGLEAIYFLFEEFEGL